MSSPAGYALALRALYLGLAFGARTVLPLKRTGSSGFKATWEGSCHQGQSRA